MLNLLISLVLFLSFACPKERNKEKDTTKTNLKLALVAQIHASMLSNLRFALFVDSHRTAISFLSVKISL